jgi:hypothetical protein
MKREGREALLNDITAVRLLRGLRPKSPPPGLTIKLRVLASRERARRLRPDAWMDRISLFCETMMRPLALPFAGGVASAVVMLSMWLIPTYPVRGQNVRGQNTVDVPTMLSTEATLKGMATVGASDNDVVIDVDIDGQGHMVDYTVVSGVNELKNPTVRRNLEIMLLFTEFTPATSFGQPMAGKIRLPMRSSRIEVKG